MEKIKIIRGEKSEASLPIFSASSLNSPSHLGGLLWAM